MNYKEVKIDGDTIYLKKSSSGYRIVYPIKINNKINWKNLIAGGNWFNLIKIGILVAVILIATNEYASAVRTANECLANSISITLPF